jgi:cyclase
VISSRVNRDNMTDLAYEKARRAGNLDGDVIVYLPDAKVAWTDSYLGHAGVAPMLLQGGSTPYLASLRRMRAALPELGTIVPGHGPVGDGHAAIDWLVGCLERLLHDVGEARRAGRSLRQTPETCPSPFADGLDPRVVAAPASYQLPQDLVRQRLLELMRNLHRLNMLATDRALESA